MYSVGIIETTGLAYLKDGTRAMCDFKYQSSCKKDGSIHYQLHYCNSKKDGRKFRKEEIECVRVVPNMDTGLQYKETIAKIALGGVYYLLQRNQLLGDGNLEKFQGQAFNMIRKTLLNEFLIKSFSPPGILAFSIEALVPEEILSFLLTRLSPTTRRHYISLSNRGPDSVVQIVVMGMLFWEVFIRNVNFNIPGKLEAELFLIDMGSVPASQAGNSMYTNGKIAIDIYLD